MSECKSMQKTINEPLLSAHSVAGTALTTGGIQKWIASGTKEFFTVRVP